MSNYRIRDLSTYIVLKVKLLYYRPQRSCEGYVFTGVCLSTGGCAIPACIAGGIPACLAAGLGGCYTSMHCRWYASMPCSRSPRGGACSSRCLLGGCLLGGCLLQGGSAPRGCLLWGVWRPPCKSRRLLLRTVRILLECTLVL